MNEKTFIITLCLENSQELAEYVNVLNHLSDITAIRVNIISLELLYHDLLFSEILRERARFDYKVLKIAPVFKLNRPFTYLSSAQKAITVLKRRKEIIRFAEASNLVLVGIQSVFQRLLYSCLKDRPFIAFHRAILFEYGGETSRTQRSFARHLGRLLKLIGLDYLISPQSGVGYAHHYLVIGHQNKSYLEFNGISSDQITVVGSPNYDAISRYRSSEKQNLASEPLQVYFITSACEWIGDEERERDQKQKIEEIIDFANNNRHIRLTIRVHPRENAEKYTLLKKQFPFIEIDQYKSTDLFAYLAEYDVIIGGFSTVLFESMLINKPIICYLLEEELEKYRNAVEQTKMPYFTSFDDIKATIQNTFLSGGDGKIDEYLKKQQEPMSRVIYFDDKQSSSKRIAHLLLESIKSM